MTSSGRIVAAGALLAVPVAGLLLLVAQPDLDGQWEHHGAHFWLVLLAAACNAGVAYATTNAAARRWDARVFLVSLAFLSAATFLGLHALATPQVMLDTPNAGFALATPVGLLIAAGFAAASSVELPVRRAGTVMQRASLLRAGIVVAALAWGVPSLARVAPFDDPSAPERLSGWFVVIGVAGVLLYAVAALRYLALARRRPSSMLRWMVVAFVLLAEAMVAVTVGRNWHASWWEWHVLMLVAFSLVAWSAHRQWHQERFSDLYLDDTVAGEREISVLFADLQGFTTFSERHDAREVAAMLNEYFDAVVPPVIERFGGSIDGIIGDAVMVVFNRRNDQPDHAHRAALAALAVQDATSSVADSHPGWPRFRVGVNSGVAAVGVVGTTGGRVHTAIGDTVNVAARLEGVAPAGGVVIGNATRRQLDGAVVEALGAIAVKGKTEPVEAYRLLSV